MSRSSQTFAPVQARTSFWEKVVAVFAWLWRHVIWSIWTTVIVGGFLVGVVLVSFVTKGTSGLNDPRTWVVIQPLLAHPLASTIGLIVLGIVILCAFLAYHHQKRVTRAEQQAYKALGGEHPVVATNLNNIALLYQFQGRHEEAERLYRQALAISMDVPGGTRAS